MNRFLRASAWLTDALIPKTAELLNTEKGKVLLAESFHRLPTQFVSEKVKYLSQVKPHWQSSMDTEQGPADLKHYHRIESRLSKPLYGVWQRWHLETAPV